MITLKYLASRFINRAKLINFKHAHPQKSAIRFCTIRRTFFIVPSDNKRKVDKGLLLGVDCLVFDLANTVHEDNKQQARENVSELLKRGNVSKRDPEWCVRINSVQSGREFICDIEAILSTNRLPAAIALPGVDNLDHLQWFTELVLKRLEMRNEEDRGPMNLILVIDSAKAIMRLPCLCEKAQEMSSTVPLTLSALVFDSDSLSDTLGTIKTTHKLELLYSRQKLVLVAKAFGLQAIDIVHTNPAALGELESECKEGYTLGFTGKQVLYPNQIPVVNSEFCPTRSKIKRAQAVVKQYQKREEEDKKGNESHTMPMDPDTRKISEHILNVARVSGKNV